MANQDWRSDLTTRSQTTTVFRHPLNPSKSQTAIFFVAYRNPFQKLRISFAIFFYSFCDKSCSLSKPRSFPKQKLRITCLVRGQPLPHHISEALSSNPGSGESLPPTPMPNLQCPRVQGWESAKGLFCSGRSLIRYPDFSLLKIRNCPNSKC